MRKRIRGGRGLGDAIYLQSCVRHLVRKGVDLEVCTDFPELFDFPVSFDQFSRHNIDYLCHYTKGKQNHHTNQWQDICESAGIGEAELKLDWKPRNIGLANEVIEKSGGRKILFVHGGRTPMNRKDNFGNELLPNKKVFAEVLEKLKNHFFTVYCGRGERIFNPNVDLDLNNRTDVSSLVDVASISSAFFGQCSFIIPLAESFNKPLLVLWSSLGLNSSERYISTITPRKILSKPSSRYIVDTWGKEELNSTVDELCGL